MSTNLSLAPRRGTECLRILAAIALLFSSSLAVAATGLVVKGDVGHELQLTVTEIHDLPHVEITATDGHSGQKIAFRGVLLSELLGRAGAALGDKLRGKELAAYIVAGAADGYRVVLSLSEADPGLTGSEVLIADSADGKPLDEKTGPLRLVVPHDKRPARWVRQLTTLQLVKVP